MIYAYIRISKKKTRKTVVDGKIKYEPIPIEEQVGRQKKILEDWLESKGWTVPDENWFIDTISGKVTEEKRIEYHAMKNKLVQGDSVVTAEVDRLGRGDYYDAKEEYMWYAKNKINLFITEIELLNIDFSEEPDDIDMAFLKDQVISMYVYMARKEVLKNNYRTKTGLAAKREAGVILGAPRKLDHEKIIKLYNKGLSYEEITKITGAKTPNISYIIRKNGIKRRK